MRRLPPYSDEDISKYMAGCTDEEAVIFSFCLESMARDREVALCRVGDLDFEQGGVHLRTRLDEQVIRERFVPVTAHTMIRLRQHCNRKTLTALLFPPKHGTLKRSFDTECKRVAKRTGLMNWRDFTLHRWRRTGARRLYEAGVPLKEIQRRLGHVAMFETLNLLELERVVTIQSRDITILAGD